MTTRTLQRWRAEGFGPRWLRIGGRILYPRDEVLAYERRQREPG
nr:helix-turn-helix domain-containing protein [Pelagovum pacificum]